MIKLKSIRVFFLVNFPFIKKNKFNTKISRVSGQFCAVIPVYGKASKILNLSGQSNFREFACYATGAYCTLFKLEATQYPCIGLLIKSSSVSLTITVIMKLIYNIYCFINR